jgi:hypothetical protein
VPGSYPLNIDVTSPPRVAQWRPLVNWVLVVPHLVWLLALQLGVGVVSVLGWVAVLCTGRLPERWSDYIMGVLRHQWRVTTFLYGWTDVYPPFSPPAGHVDPGDFPAVLYCARPLARNRLTVAFRAILVLPHLVALAAVGVAVGAVLLVAWVAVVATGQWPEELRRLAVGGFRWSSRVQAYAHLVTDEYPPFGFAA